MCRLLFVFFIVWGHAFPVYGKMYKFSDPGPDLPPIGRSKFDQVIASQNKNTEKLLVPFPFDKLLALIKSKIDLGDAQFPISFLLFPFGRSLQRFAAEPEFFKYPRVVIAVNAQSVFSDKHLKIDLQSKLYIGYVETTNMLEVISYNEKAARYEFQVVKNYKKGATPEIFYAKRRLCMTCHEAGLPIFPSEPWSESSDNSLLAKEIIKARGSKTYFGYPIEPPDMSDRIFSAEAMKADFNVAGAGRKQFAQKILDLICDPKEKDRIDCLGTGLKVAMAANNNYWPGKQWQLLITYSKFMDRYYENNGVIQVPFPFLPDRDPVNNLNPFGLSPVNAVDKFPYKDRKKNIELLRKNIVELPPLHDPKKSRMQINLISRQHCQLPINYRPVPYQKYCNTGYFLELFSLGDLINIKNLYQKDKKFDFKAYENAIDGMIQKARKDKTAALAQRNLQRSLVLAELIGFARNGKEPTVCCQNEIKEPAKLLPGGVSQTSIFDKNIKQLFTYCGNCHSEPSIEYPLQFLYGTTEDEVKSKIIKNWQNIHHSITNKVAPMPPKTSKEYSMLDRKTRSKLAQYLLREINKKKSK